jgi:hypothetical protein
VLLPLPQWPCLLAGRQAAALPEVRSISRYQANTNWRRKDLPGTVVPSVTAFLSTSFAFVVEDGAVASIEGTQQDVVAYAKAHLAQVGQALAAYSVLVDKYYSITMVGTRRPTKGTNANIGGRVPVEFARWLGDWDPVRGIGNQGNLVHYCAAHCSPASWVLHWFGNFGVQFAAPGRVCVSAQTGKEMDDA